MMPPAPGCSLDEIIADPIPGRFAVQQPAETAAFLRLSSVLASEPGRAVQQLVDSALLLTQADSSGLSVESHEDGRTVFRWIATAGEFARYRNGTMDRYFSPCGTVLERRKPLLMREPARYYPYVGELHVPVRSALLAPYLREGKFVGTVWVAAHGDKTFTTEDLRIVQNLATFASSVLDAIGYVH